MTLGAAYRGRSSSASWKGKLRAINVVSVQQYLDAVVPSEMPSSWLPDALERAGGRVALVRALGPQARRRVRRVGSGQSYAGVAAETSQGDAAVDATKGQVLTYDGAIATTVYSSSTGGRTQSAADAWGGGAPYLVSVKDPYDTVSPYHNWGSPSRESTSPTALGLSASGRRDRYAQRLEACRATRRRGVRARRRDALDLHRYDVAAALNLRSTWFSVGVLSLLPPSPNAAVSPNATVTLTGFVRGVKNVVLQEKPAGGAWTQLDTVTPDPGTGAISIDVTPSATTDYRLATPTAAAASIRITVSRS